MEQELRLGLELELGGLALLKQKYLGRLFKAIFFKFSWAKIFFKNQKHCSVCTKSVLSPV